MPDHVDMDELLFRGDEPHFSTTPVRWYSVRCMRCGASIRIDATQPAQQMLDELWDHRGSLECLRGARLD